MKESGTTPDHPRETSDEIVLGVVGFARGVRFLAAAHTRAGLYEKLAGYVSSAAGTQLFPEQCQNVRDLVATGQHAAAIASYFEAVGERWDVEWLYISTVRLGHGSGSGSCSDSDAVRLPGTHGSSLLAHTIEP